jgi:hypothetical protein
MRPVGIDDALRLILSPRLRAYPCTISAAGLKTRREQGESFSQGASGCNWRHALEVGP